MNELSLVLLPGLDGTGLLFRPLIEHLPPRLRPIVVSYPHDRSLGYSELLPIVQQSLPRSAPFALLGESFSGPLALMAAAAPAPAGLSALILCASFVRSPLPAVVRWCRPFVRGACFRALPESIRAAMLLGRHADPALRRFLAEAVAKVPSNVMAHRVRATLNVDVRAELRRCSVPLLYLRGTTDRLVGERSAADVTAGRPPTQLVRLPAPHLVLQTQPAAAAAAIAEFLAGVSALADPAKRSDAAVV